jgi:putative methyltransferase (TIGR04325 family)
LIHRLKIFIRGLLSPVLGFSLSKNWKTASSKSSGYESKSTLETLKLRIEKIAHLENPEDDPRIRVVLSHIKDLISDIPLNEEVQVLDIGGSFGEYFFYATRAIDTHTFNWTVLETEGHCSIVPEFLKSTSGLTFISELPKEAPRFDIALLSSVIQYVEYPYELLEFACSKANAVIVNRLPLAHYTTDRAAVQRPGLLNSKGSYPVHIFSESVFLNRVSSFAEVASRWMVPQDSAVIRFKYVENQGMLLIPLSHKTV